MSSVKISYVDAPSELGSLHILTRLNVKLHSGSARGEFSHSRTVDAATVGHEHRCAHPVLYINNTAEMTVELRDTADCWIRFTIPACNGVIFADSRFRRIVSVAPVDVCCAHHEFHLSNRFSEFTDSIVLPSYHKTRELVCELCVQFFEEGWVTGTGGSISIRHGERIYMTPSGVQKERIQPDELFVLGVGGEILSVPVRKPGCREPKLSDCAPLFLHAFQQRNAGAVLHSHAICCNLVTSIFAGQSEFRISHQEMIKGITGYGYFDELTIPIIENTAWECELSDSLGEAIAKHPKACAVLVRRHGMYVWGDSWEQAKRHAECLHYLFEVALEMRRLGMDFNSPPAPVLVANGSGSQLAGRKRPALEVDNGHHAHGANDRRKYFLFDIEGTTTPITFVKDVLFPYAYNKVEAFLDASWANTKTTSEVHALLESAAVDPAYAEAVKGLSSKKDKLAFLVNYVRALITADSKLGALKQLQGHMWSEGYASGELQSIVYEDVPTFFTAAKAAGASVAIYSSGSREAQHLLFRYSNHGDLRHYLSAYFDTKIGTKRDANSYKEIIMTLGAEWASDVTFVTDIVEEAEAASQAGMTAVIAMRPGNAPVKQTEFRCISNLAELDL